jgi:hypothetical protein
MSLTREQWDEISRKLQSFWTPVRLLIDGYEITLQLERISVFENAILVWINGQWKGEWVLNDCEERRRFFKPTKRRNAFLARLQKSLGKRRAAQICKGMSPYFTGYSQCWKSFPALKRHLIANNESIDLAPENAS